MCWEGRVHPGYGRRRVLPMYCAGTLLLLAVYRTLLFPPPSGIPDPPPSSYTPVGIPLSLLLYHRGYTASPPAVPPWVTPLSTVHHREYPSCSTHRGYLSCSTHRGLTSSQGYTPWVNLIPGLYTVGIPPSLLPPAGLKVVNPLPSRGSKRSYFSSIRGVITAPCRLEWGSGQSRKTAEKHGFNDSFMRNVPKSPCFS